MSRGPRIPKIKFLAIVADIQKHPNTKFKTIAARHNVSDTSVSNINRARTWGNWLAGRQATVTVRNAVKTAPKTDRAVMAGLNPTPRKKLTEGRYGVSTPDDVLAANLADLTKPVQKGEFRHVTGGIHERLDAQRIHAADATSAAIQARRQSNVAFFVSLLALVLSIIALVN